MEYTRQGPTTWPFTDDIQTEIHSAYGLIHRWTICTISMMILQVSSANFASAMHLILSVMTRLWPLRHLGQALAVHMAKCSRLHMMF